MCLPGTISSCSNDFWKRIACQTYLSVHNPCPLVQLNTLSTRPLQPVGIITGGWVRSPVLWVNMSPRLTGTTQDKNNVGMPPVTWPDLNLIIKGGIYACLPVHSKRPNTFHALAPASSNWLVLHVRMTDIAAPQGCQIRQATSIDRALLQLRSML